ncbi:MAG: hypothetical protein M3508_01615 [Actinomycetota bacterium]|nr:hypothetical protein [Actinomycetota bacterium]
MHVRAALAAALSLSLVAACSSGRESPVSSESETAATDGETTGTGTDTQTSDPTASGPVASDPAATDPVGTDPIDTDPPASEPTIPDGTTEVESSSLGITFAVPETYTVLDPAELGDDFYQGAAIEELAARAGLTIEEFERFLKEVVELYVFAPAAAEGFVDNVTVASVPSPDLPTAEQLQQTFEGLGAQNLTVDPGSQRGLDYLQSVYELPIGQQVVYGADLHILIDGTPVEITATAGTRQTADDLGALVLDTVASR